MFEISGNSSFGNIGQRNAESVKKVMARKESVSQQRIQEEIMPVPCF